MNGCAFVWSEAQLLTTVSSRGAREDKRICHSGEKKGRFSLTAHCSARGFVFPSWGGARSQRAHPRRGGQTSGHLHLRQRARKRSCCHELPAEHRAAGGEAGARLPARCPGGSGAPWHRLFLLGGMLAERIPK